MTLLEPTPTWGSFQELAEVAAACTKCPLAEHRTQVVFGVGDRGADLVFVGEGPGAEEDRQGIPFVGRAGQLLTRLIEGIGLRRDDVYICNVVKCRPPGNRDPLPAEIDACRPYLEAQLDFVAPRVLVTLGNFATRLLLETKEGITKLRGREIPYRAGRAVLIPTLHPAAVLRNGGTALAQARADFVVVKRALARANAG
jgi:DNA polymerase